MSEPITKQDMYQLQQAITLLQTKVDKALSYLYDDVNTSTPGLVQMCRDHEKRLEEIEEQMRSDKRDKQKLSSFWGVVGGALVMLVAKIIEYFITKR